MRELRDNPISPTVDFDRDGVQHGFLKLPYSRDDSAWGAVMIPLIVAGEGGQACVPGGGIIVALGLPQSQTLMPPLTPICPR